MVDHDTDATAGIDSLTDPKTLADREDVPFDEETQAVTETEFERRDAWDGVAVVGATTDDGDLLLAKLADGHGWMLPNGPVEPGDDYLVAAAHWAESMTGVAIAVDGIEHVHRKHYRTDSGRETTGYHVVLRGSPVDGTAVADDPGLPGQDVETVGWFADPPTDADWDHSDFKDDIRRFLSKAPSD